MSTETIYEKPAPQMEHRWWLFTACVSLGPLGAALVVQAHGWLSGFLMPGAVAALGGFGVFLFAGGNGAKTESRRLDGIGALTCAAGLLGLVFSPHIASVFSF
jgi:hypothetical protein